jgi:four helix bundle protein
LLLVFGFSVKMQTAKSKSGSYQNLAAGNLAINLVKEVEQITTKFPSFENFGLTKQISRAAVSIPSNLAKGQGGNSADEFGQFLTISPGSLAELAPQLIYSLRNSLLIPGGAKCLSGHA